jgi:hypothetical protein
VTIVLVVIVGALLASTFRHGKTPTARATPSPSTSSPSSSLAPTPSPTSKAETGATPALPDGLDVSGNGIKQTETFTAKGDWQLDWSYDCSNLPGPAIQARQKLVIVVYKDINQRSSENKAVANSGPRGSGTTRYKTGGTFFLGVVSDCAWHVVVKG